MTVLYSKADHRLQEHGAADWSARHADVRHLEAHADGERDVSEVDEGGGLLAGQLQPSDALGVLPVVQVSVTHREGRVRHRPGGRDGEQAQARDDASELRGERVRLAHEDRRRHEAGARSEQGDDVDERAPGVLAPREVLGGRLVGGHDDRPGEPEQGQGAGVPRGERSGMAGQAAGGARPHRDLRISAENWSALG